ncbi:PH domain-containing protein [Naasia sp. SYSU D00948]|uniref:PH domain-containing protein n=1 Tax=Naasia sp. SYSU D00948 TaxID=2817379 RepID=UPI001B313ACA|nr:PH domain-containing protein [Naasia sp. SYSU D00948]
MVTGVEPAAGEWRRVSPKQIGVELAGAAGSTLFAGALAVGAYVVGIGFMAAVFGAAALIALAMMAVVPRRVRSYGYQLREDDLLFRRGLLFQRFVAIPYGRMQLIDINRGPLSRALGLSELKFVTAAAATGVTIPGLPEAEAEELRDRLVELAETRRVGL